MVVTIPSWCNEKTHSTNVTTVLASSTLLGTFLFITIGVLGAMAYHIDDKGDILSAINSSPEANLLSTVAVFVYPLACLATSIPVFCIIIRYNLLENKICSKFKANFFAVVLPWLVVIPFYTGNGLEIILNWSTITVGGVINFIIPFLIYIKARYYKMNLDKDQAKIMDLPLDTGEDQDTILCGRVFPAVEHAKPHYAFGNLFEDESPTPIIISATIAVILGICCVGIFVINIIQTIKPI